MYCYSQPYVLPTMPLSIDLFYHWVVYFSFSYVDVLKIQDLHPHILTISSSLKH